MKKNRPKVNVMVIILFSLAIFIYLGKASKLTGGYLDIYKEQEDDNQPNPTYPFPIEKGKLGGKLDADAESYEKKNPRIYSAEGNDLQGDHFSNITGESNGLEGEYQDDVDVESHLADIANGTGKPDDIDINANDDNDDQVRVQTLSEDEGLAETESDQVPSPEEDRVSGRINTKEDMSMLNQTVYRGVTQETEEVDEDPGVAGIVSHEVEEVVVDSKAPTHGDDIDAVTIGIDNIEADEGVDETGKDNIEADEGVDETGKDNIVADEGVDETGKDNRSDESDESIDSEGGEFKYSDSRISHSGSNESSETDEIDVTNNAIDESEETNEIDHTIDTDNTDDIEKIEETEETEETKETDETEEIDETHDANEIKFGELNDPDSDIDTQGLSENLDNFGSLVSNGIENSTSKYDLESEMNSGVDSELADHESVFPSILLDREGETLLNSEITKKDDAFINSHAEYHNPKADSKVLTENEIQALAKALTNSSLKNDPVSVSSQDDGSDVESEIEDEDKSELAAQKQTE